nr:UvrD-helicase domain-containing protein [Bradyrhizobium sp. 142]
MRQPRALVCENSDTRAWLAGRYAHLLVDELQDTDPVQVEIVFCIAAHVAASDLEQCRLAPRGAVSGGRSQTGDLSLSQR